MSGTVLPACVICKCPVGIVSRIIDGDVADCCGDPETETLPARGTMPASERLSSRPPRRCSRCCATLITASCQPTSPKHSCGVFSKLGSGQCSKAPAFPGACPARGLNGLTYFGDRSSKAAQHTRYAQRAASHWLDPRYPTPAVPSQGCSSAASQHPIPSFVGAQSHRRGRKLRLE